MSCRRTGLWILIGTCALACAAEERDFGGTDAAVKADDDESSASASNDAAPGVADAGMDGSVPPPDDTDDPTDEDPTEETDEETESSEDTDETDPEETDEETSDTEVTDEPTETETTTTETTEPTVDAGPEEAGVSPACLSDVHCDDLNACNGTEACVEGECQQGTWPENGDHCEVGDDAALRVCSNGNCVLSICGDGYADDRRDEVCDDANANNSDGCTVGCAYSCSLDEECDDALYCNGAETCDTELHMCLSGTWVDEGVECGDGMLCHSGECVPEGCGNGAVEADTEQCDDGNVETADGCEADCTFTCKEDADCDDGSVCTGSETCDPELHVCLPGEQIVCEAPDECSTAECDPVSGCYYPLIDVDGDRQASSELECGTDCDDADYTVYSGAAELCDGKDNNCNDATDETAPTWYPDCDGDGYAPTNSAGTQQCSAPEQPPAECAGRGLVGAWTSTAPVSGNADCWDDSAAVHPMDATENNNAWSSNPIEGRPVSVDFDYNCDDTEEPRDDNENVSSSADCGPPVFEPAGISPQAGGGSGQVILLCFGTAGWTDDSPACGYSGGWTHCSSASGSCQRVTNYNTYKTCR